MTINSIDFSIIIVNYNTRDLLRACLSTVYQSHSKATIEVIIVDNNSTDGSVEMIRADFKQAQVIVNEENKGFSKGCNQGIKLSLGKYILLLNSDVEIFPDTLDKLKFFLDNERSDPNIGIIGCKILNPDGSLQYSVGKFPTLWSTFVDMFKPYHKRKYYLAGYDKAHEVDWVTGACMLIDREVISDSGLFDERYFMYYEEVDWCHKAKKKGWKVFYYPFASIIHKTPCAVKKHELSEKVATEIRRSHLYYYRKNQSYLAFLMLSIVTLTFLLIKFFYLYAAFFLEKEARRSRQKKVRLLFWAVWNTFWDLNKKRVMV